MGAEDGAGFLEEAPLHPHISVSIPLIPEGGVTPELSDSLFLVRPTSLTSLMLSLQITEPRRHSPANTDAGSGLQRPAVHSKQPECIEVGRASSVNFGEVCCHAR